MKHIIILGDGMADWAVKSLGDKTLLQYAKTPYMDKLARMGRNGRLITVADGFHPGSEVANMSVLGYNLPKVYEGRGPLEAASIGVDLQPGEMAMRCNLICTEGDILKNHSAGHITTEEADVLIQYLQEKLGDDRVRFHTGVQYRHLLVVKGGNKQLDCTPPHDVPLKPFRPLMVKPLVPEAEETASLLNELILKSQELLKDHPLNLKRMAEGKDPANSIWPWSPGRAGAMRTLAERHGITGAVISAVDVINGLGRCMGMDVIEVPGATGYIDTNYEGKAQAVLQALADGYDFIYTHVEAMDEVSHAQDLRLKLQAIEDFDRRIVGRVMQAAGDSVAYCVLPDHPVPLATGRHTRTPVPLALWQPGNAPDSVRLLLQIFHLYLLRSGKCGKTHKNEHQ